MLVSLLAGCGSSDESAPGLASLAPPDVPLYAEATVRPQGDQADAVSSIVERVAGSTEPLSRIPDELDAALAESGAPINYQDDIEPWLGEHAAVFVRSFDNATADGFPDLALIFEVDDVDAARSFVEHAISSDPGDSVERTYRGDDYYASPKEGVATGIVDDMLVFGTEEAFKLAVDTSQGGQSLAESDEFVDRTDSLPDDALGTVFLDPGPVLEAAIAADPSAVEGLRMWKPLLAGPLSAPVAASLSATDDTASLDLATMVDGADGFDEAQPMVGDLPAGAWFAAAIPELGPALARTADELEKSGLPGAGALPGELRAATGLDLGDDILSWLGGVAGFVEGTDASTLKIGLIAEADDSEAPRKLVDRLRGLVQRQLGAPAGPAPEHTDYGFEIPLAHVQVGVTEDSLVGAFGTTIADVLEPESSLADDDRYQDAVGALGDDFSPLLYTYLPSFFTVAELGGAGDDPDYRVAEPYLDAFSYLIAGTRMDDGVAVSRLVVGLDG
jgi:Protein of unknown function (DUF3352)